MSELLKEEIEVNWPEQKVQRLASGDKLDQSREVVYYAYFKGAVKAARAQVDLEDIGFKTEAEAVQIVNSSEYGLSGSIWTRDIGRGIRVARAVESGNLSVNSHSSVRYWTPFGGFKQSGLGREGARQGIEDYVEIKYLCLGDVLK